MVTTFRSNVLIALIAMMCALTVRSTPAYAVNCYAQCSYTIKQGGYTYAVKGESRWQK
jgi:hypothetical protein